MYVAHKIALVPSVLKGDVCFVEVNYVESKSAEILIIDILM
jgi:hypothetical protein